MRVIVAASALLLAVLVGFWVWPRAAEPAPWAAGPLATLNRQEAPADSVPQLRGWVDGEVSLAIVVACSAPGEGTRALSIQLHTLHDGVDAEMHTRVKAMSRRVKQRAEFRRFAMAEIATDGGPALAVDLPLDATGSRVALALVRDGEGFRIGHLDPATGIVDFFTSQGLRLHVRRMFAVRLPVGEGAATARLGTDALVSFHAACG